MSPRYKLLAALAGLGLLGAGAASWLAQHDARVRAEAAVQASSKSAADAADQIKQLEAQDAARQAQAAATIDAMQKLVSAVSAGQDAAANRAVAAATGKSGASTAGHGQPACADSAESSARGAGPDPASGSGAAARCRRSVKLAGAQADADSKAQQLAASRELSAVEAERDAWKKAARGTFWSRLKTAAKYIVIGGAIGAGALCGTGHCK